MSDETADTLTQLCEEAFALERELKPKKKRLEGLRTEIKNLMGLLDVIDWKPENSDFGALIELVDRDEFDLPALLKALPRVELAGEVTLVEVNVPVVKEMIRGGALNRAALMRAGAITPKLFQRRLTVKRIRQ
jgi:hypothetical protein